MNTVISKCYVKKTQQYFVEAEIYLRYPRKNRGDIVMSFDSVFDAQEYIHSHIGKSVIIEINPGKDVLKLLDDKINENDLHS